MSEVAALIADMVRAGVDPEIIGRTAAALSQREAVLVPDESAERRRAADRERKRLRKSAEVVGSAEAVPPKEVPPAPPQEITPSEPTTPKENPPKGGQKKAVRLPSDFQPDLGFAIGQGLSERQAAFEADKFRDYWTGKGRDAAKRDWPATWRNWVRTAAERLPQARGSPPRPRTTQDVARDLLRKMEAADASTDEEIERGPAPPLRLSSYG